MTIKYKDFQEKLSAYAALGTAFLALPPHEVEAAVSYTDLPDLEICMRTTNRSIFIGATDNGNSRIAEPDSATSKEEKILSSVAKFPVGEVDSLAWAEIKEQQSLEVSAKNKRPNISILNATCRPIN